MRALCPNCRTRPRLRADGTLAQHDTAYRAPCRLAQARPDGTGSPLLVRAPGR